MWFLGGIKQLGRKISGSGYLLNNCVFAFVFVYLNLDFVIAILDFFNLTYLGRGNLTGGIAPITLARGHVCGSFS